ncbi:iron chelate uptake ABC transporter family permease subunit, partial [Pseudomonas aeruginosa]|uniref:iron chelate uptake ABC transporter family permease subunit n=1 Tax=Pseudomonas aeruginosa TaxID=287 RepID=UPI001D0D407E
MNGLHALRLGSLSLRWRPRAALACLVLAGIGLALAAALLGTGSLALGPAEVFASLLGQGQDPTAQRIVQRVRLPRVLTACLVGAALGMAGAIFQSISRNPLGSPDVIGFTTGAASEVASGPASNRMICTMAPLAAPVVKPMTSGEPSG